MGADIWWLAAGLAAASTLQLAWLLSPMKQQPELLGLTRMWLGATAKNEFAFLALPDNNMVVYQG